MQTRSDDLNNAGSLQRRSQSVICQIVEPAVAKGTGQATNQPHRPRTRACPGSIYTGIHCQQLQLGREWNGRPSLHLLTWLVTNVEGESLTYPPGHFL